MTTNLPPHHGASAHPHFPEPEPRPECEILTEGVKTVRFKSKAEGGIAKKEKEKSK